MNDLVERDSVPELLHIAHCRALLGNEARQLSDDDIDAMRRHALGLEHTLIDVFLQPSLGVAELRVAIDAKAADRSAERESGRPPTEGVDRSGVRRAGRIGPPWRLRRYGAASFACQRLAWLTEPKLAEGERRMVDLTNASWNRIAGWLCRLEGLRQSPEPSGILRYVFEYIWR